MILDFLFWVVETVVGFVITILPSTPDLASGLTESFGSFAEVAASGIGVIKLVVPGALLTILFTLLAFEFTAVPIWKLLVFIYEKIPFKSS